MGEILHWCRKCREVKSHFEVTRDYAKCLDCRSGVSTRPMSPVVDLETAIERKIRSARLAAGYHQAKR